MKKKRKKLLFIEDDKKTAEVAKSMLAYNEWEVLVVESGERALKEINVFRPDAILLDILLPGMNGLELFKLLRENMDYKKPIIIFSNLGSDHDIDAYKTYGANGYLIKGLSSMSDLVALLEKYRK